MTRACSRALCLVYLLACSAGLARCLCVVPGLARARTTRTCSCGSFLASQTKKGMSLRAAGESEEPSSVQGRPEEVAEGKKRLLLAVAKGGKTDVLLAARELELLAPAGESSRELVGGDWSLVFSTQTDSTLGPGPDESVVDAVNAALYRFFFKFAPFLAGGQDRKAMPSLPVDTRNQQNVDLATMRVDNRVFLQLGKGGPQVKIRVVGDLQGEDSLDLAVTFTSFFLGASPLPSLELPLPRPVGRLRTTFCDGDMRLSRGGRGGIFVLKRLNSQSGGGAGA
jgi:hypothetical protein